MSIFRQIIVYTGIYFFPVTARTDPLQMQFVRVNGNDKRADNAVLFRVNVDTGNLIFLFTNSMYWSS